MQNQKSNAKEVVEFVKICRKRRASLLRVCQIIDKESKEKTFWFNKNSLKL